MNNASSIRWDKTRDDRLRKLAANGLSAKQISDQFGDCSRSSVIGRAHRLKLKLGGGSKKPVSNAKTKPAPQHVEKPAKLRTAFHGKKLKLIAGVAQVSIGTGPKAVSQYDFKTRAEQRALAPAVTVRRANAFDPLPDIDPVPFGSKGCKWPVDGLHGRGRLWCGSPKIPGESYCAIHSQLAINPRATTGGMPAERTSA